MALAFIGLMSVVTFAAYARDKRAARAGDWRTREGTLLLLAAIGGSPGALIGQNVLRHKRRKRSYQRKLYRIVVLQLLVVLSFSIPAVRNGAGAVAGAVSGALGDALAAQLEADRARRERDPAVVVRRSGAGGF